jgi:hypothetical protein
VEELLFGGAKGGTKSVLLCFFALWKAKKIIDILKLLPSQYPLPVGFIGRKRAVDFTDTTLETWKAFVPTEAYQIRTQEKEIIIDGTVKILFGGLDDEENIKKFNSAEFVFFCIDQAEEISRDDMAMLRATLYRFKKPLPKEEYKVLLTSNPSDCWLKQDFITGPLPTRKFLQALPSDNEFIDVEKYVQQLREAFGHRPELISAYVEGSWEQLEEQEFLIRDEWIENAKNLELPRKAKKILVSCDPAWLGQKTDEIVIYVFENARKIDGKFLFNRSTVEVAGEIVKLIRQYNAGLVAIDVIGIGAGVYDNVKILLGDSAVRIIPVNSATACEDDADRKKYVNLRAKMWWEVSRKFAENQIPLDGDVELARELKAVKYVISNGRIKIEEKKDVKARLGRSPDRADAFIQGEYFLDQCPHLLTDRKEKYVHYTTPRRAY